jgi:hypothetical protein
MSALQDVLSRVHISEVYTALTGMTLRRTGNDIWRARATWRDGDGFNVSMDDGRNVWHDFVSDEGGGVLDLVARVRGGSRVDALRWLADFAGMPLKDRALSPKDRQRWAREFAEAERTYTEATYFADAAALMAEWALEELSPDDTERAVHTALIARLRISPEAEYRAWLDRDPTWAAALVQAGRERARRLQIALARWIVEGMSGVSGAI